MREVRRTCLEALVLVVASVVLALGVNAVRDDGLVLRRQYFPRLAGGKGPSSTPATQATMPGVDEGPAVENDPVKIAEKHLAAEGINIARHADVKAMLADPLFGATQFLVDARDDEHYSAGHIAGAYQLDHYHIDRFLPDLMPLLLPAQKVIVYCNGGHCEDSEATAIELMQRGVDRSKIFVYAGGYQDWIAHSEQLEKGERGSGQLIAAPAAE